MTNRVFTIGHSTHSLEKFISLLTSYSVTAVCDVRSQPYSRLNPQFNRETLMQALAEHRIAYVFLGRELGARSPDPSCYVDGKVDYDRLAQTSLFRRGLERIREGAKRYVIALMCAERDPLECHRSILVARHLVRLGFSVDHILHDAMLESHTKALERLVQQLSLPREDLFHSPNEIIDEAYRIQGRRIAYKMRRHIPSGALPVDR